ncbi:MAG: hypothetical protein CMH65_03620, partial [Nevskiales bacterium]|nr:hypothetical protein [Nevskiales bacterium]
DFLCAPKENRRKETAPDHVARRLSAAGALRFSQPVGVADGPSWPDCNGFGIPASLGAARRLIHRLLRCSAT